MQNRYSIIRKLKKKRETYRYFNRELALEIIAGWGKGLELFGFTKGQFSMIDLLQAVLDKTGQADVVISTWTAAAIDLQRCLSFLQRDKVGSMMWIVDESFERRVPEFALKLRQMFGEGSIRIIPTHCKFILIKNQVWNVVIQTSMNLNRNFRMENFWICEDKDFYDSYYELVDMIFKIQKPGAGFGRRPKDTMEEFKRLGEKQDEFDFSELDDTEDFPKMEL